MKKYLSKGFTLVELLIVIALLGVIATIVIAAINPIEQANRARDAGYRADGGQLLSAIERYFVAHNEFPWVTAGSATSNDASFGFVSANNLGVGICAATGDCSDGTAPKQGYLITGNELKTEFMGRDFIKAKDTEPAKQLMVGKSAGAAGSSGGSESVYACYIPAANSTRQTACAAGKVFTISAADGTRTAIASATCKTVSGSAWVTAAYYVCIPD